MPDRSALITETKKGFILFKDLIETTNSLDDAEAGMLFKAILSHQNGLGLDSFDKMTKLLMSQIINQFNREDQKWIKRRDASAANGKKGGRPRNNPLGSVGSENNLGEPRKPVTATVTVTGTVKKIRKGADVITYPPVLDCDEFRLKWDEWTSYRKEMKIKTLLPASVKKQFNKCAEWGLEDSLESIDDSIAKGYQGLFEPRQGRNGNNKISTEELFGIPEKAI